MEYREFFERVKGFLEQAEIHKRRGNNDFNPYLQMLSKNDEVRLHSRLICGFLNPLGNHYQGDVFLETFLECVGLKAWFDDTSNARVHKEYENIDVYITNGERHIIVENKIWAGDQDRQIERYIEIIAKEQSRDSSDIESSELESSENVAQQELSQAYENIAVLYLTLDAKDPTQQSLGKWEIQGDYLVDKQGNKVLFKAISYKDEILKWIENSQAKVGCITSLNAALLFYKDVVQIITNTKENTMSIEKFLTDNKENMQENMKIAFEILENKDKIIESYCEAIVEKCREQIESKDFEIVKTSKDKKMDSWKRNSLSYPFMIKPKNCGKYYFAFCVEYYIQKEEYSCYGVRIFEQDSDSSMDNNISSKIIEYLNVEYIWWLNDNQKFWWYAFDTSITELESKLQEFLDSEKIKDLNDKLKDYQG
ncbi:MAG: PD-(D/E)XK nuclease family protein [Helicobacter sp.]|uniref:PDDEXK-like family protein n=1 Tax=Helicobacter sp. TaxID=218 RepID=UPI00375144BC|nr:PD-(D/E)XK nuclease family protein [Helicobacter sp.]